MEIALTGCGGRLGRVLLREWEPEHVVHRLGREELDLSDPGALEGQLSGLNFAALVNCAALANVERCESERREAELVNGEAPGELARLCAERGARFIHFSTDYVLEGSKEGLKNEQAPVDPLNHYARTKLLGEERVLDVNPEALVGRVSWLFGTWPGGVVESVLQRLCEGQPLRAVGDKFSKPTSVQEISRMTLALLANDDLSGIFHLTHPGDPESWWSIACKVADLGRAAGIVPDRIDMIRQTMAEAERLQVRRPIHTAMDPERLRKELLWEGVCWEQEARRTISLLREESSAEERLR